MLAVVYYDACWSYQMIIQTGTTGCVLLHHHCFNVLTQLFLTFFYPSILLVTHKQSQHPLALANTWLL